MLFLSVLTDVLCPVDDADVLAKRWDVAPLDDLQYPEGRGWDKRGETHTVLACRKKMDGISQYYNYI